MKVTKLKIIQETMFIQNRDWIEIEDGKEIHYQVRQVRATDGFKIDYLVKVDDENVLQDIISMENKEFKNSIRNEFERIRVHNIIKEKEVLKNTSIKDFLKFKLSNN